MTSTPNYFKQESKDHYRTAVNHYLSPKRKDSVKTKWENPFSLKVIANAIKKLEEKYSPKSLRVMDFGCGIGEGFVFVDGKRKLAKEKEKLAEYSEAKAKLLEQKEKIESL